MKEPTRTRKSWRQWRRHALRRLRNAAIAIIGPPLLRLWIGTLRIRWCGRLVKVASGHALPPERCIYLFWHQNMLIPAAVYRNAPLRVVISSHGDGEMIAKVISRLGMQPVRGSSTRGGSKALLKLLREDDSHWNIVITPDGPRGPSHRVQVGAVYLASRSTLPICPVAIACEHFASLSTWDRFRLPRPFSRALFLYGEPIRVPPDLDRDAVEEARQGIEDRMGELTERVETEFDAVYRQCLRKGDLPPG